MRTVTLGDIADWGSGGTPRRGITEYFGPGVPWLSISDLNDGVVSSARESLTEKGLANSTAKVVPAGTIFVAMYGSIGKLGIAATEMCTSQAIAFAVVHEDVADRGYVFHYLRAQRPLLESRGRGGTQMNIGQADLRAWPIPLPPLPEQRRIAAILDQADAVRTWRRHAIGLLDKLESASFIDRFGDPGSWPSRWPMGTIADTAATVTYGSSAKAGSEGRWPILRMGNLTISGRLDLTDLKHLDLAPKDAEKFTVREGDLLFNRTNSPELVGKTAVVRTDESFAYAGYLIRVRTNADHNSEFISGYLNSRHGKAVLRGMNKAIIGQANINARELRSIPIALPPKPAQDEFAARVREIDVQRAAAQRSLSALDDLFASLQSRAFSGRL